MIDPKSKASHRIATDEPDYAMFLSTNPEFNTTTVRYTYQSMVTPSSVYDYDLNTRERKLLKQQPVLGGYDAKNYEAKRVWAAARDGAKVPISLVYKKGVKQDGSAPLLLYGYGSYGVSMAPTFSSSRLSLLDRGVIYAIAYIRGGGELGEEWREQGRMMQKITPSTTSSIRADHLVKNKFTSSDRLVIHGGSAGGLLVGAVVNMRPDLFKAVVAEVPFVDVLNTMLDASLPLTTSEYTEWGNPNEKPAFEYMLQVLRRTTTSRPSDYPAMLVKVSAQRQPGAVLGRRQARRQAARDEDRQQPAAAEDEHGRRPRWRVGALRRPPRNRLHVCLRAVADGAGSRCACHQRAEELNAGSKPKSQIPRPKSQVPNPTWELGIGIWDFLTCPTPRPTIPAGPGRNGEICEKPGNPRKLA